MTFSFILACIVFGITSLLLLGLIADEVLNKTRNDLRRYFHGERINWSKVGVFVAIWAISGVWIWG